MDGTPASRGELLIALALQDLGYEPRVNFSPPTRPDPKIWKSSTFEVDIVGFVRKNGRTQVFGIELDGHPEGHGKAAIPKDKRKSAAMRSVGFDAVVRVRFWGMPPIEPTDVVMRCPYGSLTHAPLHLTIVMAAIQKSLAMQGVEIEISGFKPMSVLARANAERTQGRRVKKKKTLT
jgi:hypothetical protein